MCHRQLPRACVPFPDYATDRALLHRIGGGDSFAHELLRDCFAEERRAA